MYCTTVYSVQILSPKQWYLFSWKQCEKKRSIRVTCYLIIVNPDITENMEFLAEATNDPASLPALVYRLRAQLASLMRFIAARDATLVFAATDGIGTNDELLINILCNRTKDQIYAIDQQFRNLPKNRRNQSLRECIKSETSGNYGDFLQFLTQSRGQFLAEQLHVAMVSHYSS
jgi:hypothetical protein